MNTQPKLFMMNTLFTQFNPAKQSKLSDLADQLETDFGTAILEELTGESLTRKGQPTRLFDQSRRSSEHYYPEDEHGKAYIQDFAQGKRWYPINAWMKQYDLDWKTAVTDLSERYSVTAQSTGKATPMKRVRPPLVTAPTPPPSYHDPELVESTLGAEQYNRNDFALYLRRLLGITDANEVLNRFHVGTGQHWHISPYWPRSTIFWQIDLGGKVRAGKIFHYSQALGKRLKDKKTEIELAPTWFHYVRGLNDFHCVQCLFGLHQLTNQPSDKPIAVVESEKTAVIATAFLPGFIWLACGGLGQLSAEKCKVLIGRNITLFPDLSKDKSTFNRWNDKAAELNRIGCSVSVSSLLESQTTTLDRAAGLDLADFLTRYRCPDSGRVLTEPDGYPALWDCEPINPVPSIRAISIQDYINQP